MSKEILSTYPPATQELREADRPEQTRETESGRWRGGNGEWRGDGERRVRSAGWFSAKLARVPSNYRLSKTLEQRQRDFEEISRRFPGRLPVILERHPKEKRLRPLLKPKFILPDSMSFSQLLFIVRSRLQLKARVSVYFTLADGTVVPPMGADVRSVYHQFRDPDGFLYVTFASEETFG